MLANLLIFADRAVLNTGLPMWLLSTSCNDKTKVEGTSLGFDCVNLARYNFSVHGTDLKRL